MGEGLLEFYRTKLKKEYKIAFISTFLSTLLIHLYKFANTLPNQDSVYCYYSKLNIISLGRWALSPACGISSFYDLPWVIGLMSSLFIALTVVVIVALLQMKNPVLIGLTGALFAAAPATTETFFYMFTADGYMIAMFLAALGVYLTRIGEKPWKWIAGGVCLCVSCGIYQSYISFGLILAICYFMDDLFQGRHSREESLRWVLGQAALYAVSLAVYYVIWKLCLRFSGTAANSYLGISEVGKINAGMIVGGLIGSVKTTILYFLQWNLLEHGFTLYAVLNLIFIALTGFGLVVAVVKSGILQRKWALLLLALCLIAIMPFACIWGFTAEDLLFRPMMLQCLTLLYVLGALLCERWTKVCVKNVMGILLALVVFNNALMANICYFYMQLAYERTYADGVEIMMEIHDLQDEYDFDKIAVVGTRIMDVKHETVDPETGWMRPEGKLHMLVILLNKTLLFDSDHTTKFLEANFNLGLEPVDRETREALLRSEAVQAMDCWPAENSMAVMGDTLILKMSNTEEFK